MMSTINEDEIYHCQTQLKQNRLCYIWNISDFWKIYKFGIALYSSETKNGFQLEMCPLNNKLVFYGTLVRSNYINVSYSVFVKTDKGEMTNVLKPTLITMNYNVNNLLYELPISLLFDKHKMYLSHDNTFTICFELHTFVKTYNNSISHSYTNTMSDTDIFVSKEKSDSFVSFIINNERLQANKSSLCLKSKVFEAMFNCGLEESVNNEVVITDIKYDILKELLSFVQIGHLSKTLEEINLNKICELFVAADKYDIQDLKLICEQSLIINTTETNVVEHLKIAHLNDGKMLKKYIKDFIKLYSKDIVDISEFITLMKMYPELLTPLSD
ncbi:speckle-type POZ protein B-like isoform X2 [Formica exsecta]|nr:speckle-type POZ protein B-like isoform X2 [Formica exsecta]